ncbi:TonB family protein [Bacteroides sp.]|uniref:TonB family protein n=1 Tax=Bacteroides sp. TaxID=29523 RepID=UPI00261B3242|nr:TonB family protein [Bacteroides sp.]MDD3037702.1 TonB family protein [Bacteroides sp.]
MKRGKKTCKILKEIRQQIAEANDIEFVTSECQYQGDCLGTCPKCEAEVRFLEQQLERRRITGKTVFLMGISASIMTMNASTISSTPYVSNLTKPVSNTEIFSNFPDSLITIKGIVVDEKYRLMNGVNIYEKKNPLNKTMTNEKGYFQLKVPSKSILVTEVTGMQTQEINVDKLDSICIRMTTDSIEMITEEVLMGEVAINMPEFPGGRAVCMDFIRKNLKYPNLHISGRVIVQFTVTKEGKIANAEVIHSLHPLFDKEALRVVNMMPRWVPGKQLGKPVQVKYKLPILFSNK